MGKAKRDLKRNLSTTSCSFSSSIREDSSVGFDDIDGNHYRYRQSKSILECIQYSVTSTLYYPLHSCIGLISYIVIEAAVQNQQRILSRRPSVISQIFKKSTVSFGLITFFALKVLFVDIFITVGDVCTDFWQVRVIGLSNNQFI